ncbi:MAG: hypothetical protein GY788_20570 [bacterium]|nr:hypothetical protein [bacterium]
MADAWPASLPQSFLRGTIDNALGDSILRSRMGGGPDKVRSRSSAAPDPLSGTMSMTTAQWGTLDTFFKVTLINGSLPMMFPDPDGGSDLLVRFAGPPHRNKRGPNDHRVALNLEVMP